MEDVFFLLQAGSAAEEEATDPCVAYNVVQMVCYGVMAVIIMRLKLFFSPQLCVVAGLLASKKVIQNSS